MGSGVAGGLSSKLSKATSGSSSGSALGASAGGTVTVRVVRATGLLAGDKGGTSDPFVVVQSAGDKKAKTSVKKKTLDPEWEETLELSVLDAAAPLSFVVWDHDKVGRNDHLGSAEISLAQIAPGVPTPLRLELSTQGTIEVVVTLVTDDARGMGSVAMGAAKAAMGAAAMGAAAMGRAATTPAGAAVAPVSGARAARAAAMAREAATPQVVPAVASGAAQRDRGAPLGDTASRLKRLVTGGGGSSAGQAAASSPADSDGLARAV